MTVRRHAHRLIILHLYVSSPFTRDCKAVSQGKLIALFLGGLQPTQDWRVCLVICYLFLGSGWHRSPWKVMAQKKKDNEQKGQSSPGVACHGIIECHSWMCLQTSSQSTLSNTVAADHVEPLSTSNILVWLRCAMTLNYTLDSEELIPKKGCEISHL